MSTTLQDRRRQLARWVRDFAETNHRAERSYVEKGAYNLASDAKSKRIALAGVASLIEHGHVDEILCSDLKGLLVGTSLCTAYVKHENAAAFVQYDAESTVGIVEAIISRVEEEVTGQYRKPLVIR